MTSFTNDNFGTILKHLMQLTSEALGNNTYAVAAALIDSDTGVVYNYIRNQVMENGRVKNYQNHAERGMIDWYFNNKQLFNLPEPHKLTILTTLDPCLMCGSTIIESGFNAITIALDDRAGVNYRGDGSFPFYHHTLHSHANDRFGYLEVDGININFRGNVPQIFRNIKVSKEIHDDVLKYFLKSAKIVDKLKNDLSHKHVHCDAATLAEFGYTQDDFITLDDKKHFVEKMVGEALKNTPYGSLKLANVAALINKDNKVVSMAAERLDMAHSSAAGEVMKKYWHLNHELGIKYHCEVSKTADLSVLSLYGLSARSAEAYMDLGILRPILKHAQDESQGRFHYLITTEEDNSEFIELLHHLPARYQAIVRDDIQAPYNDLELLEYANNLVADAQDAIVNGADGLELTDYVELSQTEDHILTTPLS